MWESSTKFSYIAKDLLQNFLLQQILFIYFALEPARLAFCSGVLFLLQHHDGTGSGHQHHGNVCADHGGVTGIGSGQQVEL